MKINFKLVKFRQIFLIILLSVSSVYGNNDKSDDNTYTSFLNNGLKIIVKEDHRAPVVISQIWYKVGSSYEPNGITGISHMLEHMMFKETQNLKDGEFVDIITKKGGKQNAFTSYDYTGYFQMIGNKELDTCFKLEAERMQNLVINKDNFLKEREVVMEERRMRIEDDPIAKTAERLRASAHTSSPYHHPIIGWPDDIKNYQVEDAKNWYKKWYAPNNAIVVVVGDVKAKDVFKLAAKYFGRIKPEKIEALKPRVEIKSIGENNLNIKLPAKVPVLLMAYNTPSYKTAIDNDKQNNDNKSKQDVYALEIISSILSGSESSRFPKILEREQQVATSASSSYDSFSLYNSLFSINAVPSANISIENLKKEILQQLEKLKTQEVSSQELERIKANLIASKIYEQDSIYYQAMIIGILETIDIGYKKYDDYLSNLKLVTPRQIMAAAKKYFTIENLTTAVLEPQEIIK